MVSFLEQYTIFGGLLFLINKFCTIACNHEYKFKMFGETMVS